MLIPVSWQSGSYTRFQASGRKSAVSSVKHSLAKNKAGRKATGCSAEMALFFLVSFFSHAWVQGVRTTTFDRLVLPRFNEARCFCGAFFPLLGLSYCEEKQFPLHFRR